MRCAVHNEREAVARCSVCGRGACAACLIRVGGMAVCGVHDEDEVARMRAVGLLGRAKRAGASMAGTGMLAGLGAMIATVGVLSWLSGREMLAGITGAEGYITGAAVIAAVGIAIVVWAVVYGVRAMRRAHEGEEE